MPTAIDTTNRGRWFRTLLQNTLENTPAPAWASKIYVIPSEYHVEDQKDFPFAYSILMNGRPNYASASGLVQEASEQDFDIIFGVAAGKTVQAVPDDWLSDLQDNCEAQFYETLIGNTQTFTNAKGKQYTVSIQRFKFPKDTYRSPVPPAWGQKVCIGIGGTIFYSQRGQ